MRAYEKQPFQILRRSFGMAEELEEVLNRSKSYVSERLRGTKQFSERDKRKVMEYLRKPIEQIGDYFPEVML